VEDDEFRIFYEQYGPLKVCHFDLFVTWTPSVGRRFKRLVQAEFDKIKEPVFAAFYHNGQHGYRFHKLLSWLGFKPLFKGVYDKTPCTFYSKVN
jgi:hypothetical protein